jgi:exonuclease VII small subunit
LPKAIVTVPDDLGSGTPYDIYVAPILPTFLDGNKRSGSNADDVVVLLGSIKEAKLGLNVAKGIPEITPGASTARAAAEGILTGVELTLEAINFHDGAIGASRLRATLQNTDTILDQTCSVSQKLDQANPKLDQANEKLDQANEELDQANEKLDQANQKLDQANQKLDQANEKLDDLLCPFGPGGATFTALRQGCDAIDQDCNKVFDECAEDKVPPLLTLQTSIPDKPFKSIEEARQFLQENVVESDDCAVEFSTQIVLQSEPNCCDCVFQVDTADVRCVNDNAPGSATASRNFVVKVDSAAPVINCGFFVQQDAFHVSDGFDVCAGLTLPFPGDNDPLHIDKNTIGEGLFNVGLWYQVDEVSRRLVCVGRSHAPISISNLNTNVRLVYLNDRRNVIKE